MRESGSKSFQLRESNPNRRHAVPNYGKILKTELHKLLKKEGA